MSADPQAPAADAQDRADPRLTASEPPSPGDALATSIQPELWIERASTAVAFYQAAFGATVLHQVGTGNDMVAQLSVDGAAFWVSAASPSMKRLSPQAIDGATGRTLLVVAHPDHMIEQAVAAGARRTSPAADEHGWRVGRIVDPFGHEWEIGRPLATPSISLSVMLIVPDATTAVRWYGAALGATELWNLGGVAGLTVQDAPFFLHEAVPGRANERSPVDAGLSTTRIEMFVDDPDHFIERASKAGATDIERPSDHQTPWGAHRQGGFTDPFGHRWSIGDRTPLQASPR